MPFSRCSLALALGVCFGVEPAVVKAEQLAPASPEAPSASPPLVELDYAAGSASRTLARAVTRLTAELRAASFGVRLAREPGGDAEQTLSSRADEAAAPYAKISLSAVGERLQLEISSQSLAATSHVVLVGGEADIRALALQATEFLRAGLVPRLSEPLAVVPPEAPPTPAKAQPVVKPPPPRWHLDLGPALLTNWGAADRLPLLSLGAGYALSESVSVSAAFDAPLSSESFSDAHGSADYRVWLGGLRADYAWLHWSSGTATLGLDAGVARVTSRGRPFAPLEPLDARAWAASFGASAAMTVQVAGALALLGQVRVFGLSPNPLVAILDDQRRLGSPCILFGLGARVGGR